MGTPQLFGDGAIKYHWFANAHMGAGSLITGVDVPTVGLRLWILPSVVLAVALTAALAQRAAGRSSAAAVAAILIAPVATLPWWPWAGWSTNFWNALSPSQVYANAPILLAAHALVDVVRGRASRGTWAILALATLACSGAKASALPILLGGVGLAWLASLVLRHGRVRLTALSVGAVLSTALAATFVQGGSGGSNLQLFSNLTLSPIYRSRVDRTPDLDTLVAPGFFGEGRGGLLLLALLLTFEAVRMLRLFAWLVVPAMRGLRTDLAAWFFSGVSIASLLALVLISHNGYSQYYFPYGAMPIGVVLGAWVVSDLVASSRPSRWAIAAAAAIGAGVNGAMTYRAFKAPSGSGKLFEGVASGSYRVVAVLGLIAFVALGAAVLGLRTIGPDRRHRVLALGAVALVGAVAVSGITQNVVTKPPASSDARSTLTPAEQVRLDQSRAALWIQDHVPKKAVMATNVQCNTKKDIACPRARSWWISGLGQRRVLLEGWDYVPSTGGAAFDDPELFALNQTAFSDPTPARLAALKERGVTWLVAAKGVPGAGVSPALDALVKPVYETKSVTIYRLS